MPEPSKRSQLIPFSPIRVMFRLADELERAGGGRVIRLHVGDPDFAPPDAVDRGDRRARCATERRTTRRASASTSLRVALWRRKVTRKNGIAAATDQIVVTPGSTEALLAAMEIALHPGDEILLPEIYWPNYVQQAPDGERDAGLLPARGRVPAGRSRACDRAITAQDACDLDQQPEQPDRSGHSRGDRCARSTRWRASTTLWIVSDEAYEDIVFDARPRLARLVRARPSRARRRRVFSLFTFSKSYVR